MNKGVFFRVFICVLFLGVCIYSYLDLQNGITEMRIKIPGLVTELRKIEEKNTLYQYEIERFESPENLLALAKQGLYSHLRFPICSEVITMRQPVNVWNTQANEGKTTLHQPSITFATGASP